MLRRAITHLLSNYHNRGTRPESFRLWIRCLRAPGIRDPGRESTESVWKSVPVYEKWRRGAECLNARTGCTVQEAPV